MKNLMRSVGRMSRRKTRFLLVVNLVAFWGGIVNLFVLSEPIRAYAVFNMTLATMGMVIVGHHVVREKRRQAADQKTADLPDFDLLAEEYRLEDDLELGQGKDWAAQQTIDRIDRELGSDENFPGEVVKAGVRPKEYGGYIPALDTRIQAGGITADQVWVEPDKTQVVNGDGEVVHEYPEPQTAVEIEQPIPQSHLDTIDNLNARVAGAKRAETEYWRGLRNQ